MTEAPLSPAPTTVRLLSLARRGNRSALERLLEREMPGLLRFARGRLPGWARALGDTADIVQETLIGAVRNLDRFDARRRGALGAYLRTAVVNRVRDHVRRAARRPPVDEIGGELASREPGPDSLFADAELRGRYQAALAELPAPEQQAVVARVEMGYSYEQIALALGKPSADAARMTVARALAKLARMMSREA
ncbi:MAG: sigma-70 family RNA polymerase sigma factor [Vicinamibacteria bacterium]|nr:sigma-70 family RNA polymerase sigma factor [Vicinamibacteria bacterium]